MTKKHLGISLLELMLVLAVISVLLVAVGRYFQTVERSRRVTNALEILQQINAACEEFSVGVTNIAQFNHLDLEYLVYHGMLPEKYRQEDINPWGGKVTVENEGDKLAVKLFDVDEKDCLALFDFVKHAASPPVQSPSCDVNVFTGYALVKGDN